MKARRMLVLGLAVLLTGCATGTKLEEGESATVAELDAAINNAAQRLLAGSEVAIVGAYFDATNADDVIRYDWVDYRPDGDLLAVQNYLDRGRVEGFSRIADNWMTALDAGDEEQPWQAAALATAAETVPGIGVLEAMTAQETADGVEATVTRRPASDGSVLWVLSTPLEGEEGSMAQEWIVHSSGMIQVYRISSDAGLGDGVGTIVFEYGGGDDPDPVVVPAAGTPLVLDELDIPDQLRRLESE